MPFTRVRKGVYRSPSGRRYTARQVRAYYATGGWKRPVKRRRSKRTTTRRRSRRRRSK